MNVFHEGIGDKIAQFFQWTASFVAGLSVGFATGWKIAVVVLATLPLLALAGFVMNKVDSCKRSFKEFLNTRGITITCRHKNLAQISNFTTGKLLTIVFFVHKDRSNKNVGKIDTNPEEIKQIN